MSQVTTGGLTVPDDTDPVAQGAAAMRAMGGKLAAMASGRATLPLNTAQSPGTVAVTFPAGRFTATPNVVVNRANGTSWGSIPQLYWAQDMTVNGFNVGGIANVTSAGIAMQWIATQTG